ncbi:NfrA family protein [Desulfonatronum thiodismutans]|uniref:NfrA family protein n=1 Tax=Desulfonatronum thiodismutans TaxID=159290 RepID=UPI0004ABE373|nr:tetratricopeptide repeat protein [Desulfonatronum thiodismutans]
MTLFLARAVLLLGLFLFSFPEDILAEPAAQPFEIHRTDEGVIARELRRNRTYPHQDMAFRLQAKDDIRGAANELQAFLAIDPIEVNVRLQLIILLEQLGEDTEIVEHASRILENRPNALLPRLYRAWALDRLERWDEAQADFQRVLDLPDISKEQHSDILLTLVNRAMAREDFHQVLTLLDESVQEEFSWSPNLVRGFALSALGEHTLALEAFETAALQAKSREFRNQALSAATEEAIQLGQYAQARALLTQTTQAQETPRELEPRLAELALRAGLSTEAAEHYRRAVEAGNEQARGHLAQLLFDLGQLHEAEHHAEILAQTTDPDKRKRALVMLGVIRERRGDFRGASLAFEQAAQDDLSPASWTTLGALAVKQERFDIAAQEYEKAWEASGMKDAAMAEMIVGFWTKTGRIDQAIATSLKLADNTDAAPKDRLRAMESAAHLQRQAGSPDAAARTLLRAAALPAVDAEKRTDLLGRAERLFLEGDSPEQAGDVLVTLLEDTARGPDRADVLLRLARLEQTRALPDWQERTVVFLEQAEDQLGLPPEKAAQIAESSAEILISQGDRIRALQAMERAVIRGGEQPGRMLQFGYALAAMDLHHRARDAFARAAELGAGDMAWVGLARSYQRLDQPGLALHALNQALFMRGQTVFDSKPSLLPQDEQYPVLMLLGYLNEELARHDLAVVWYEKALALQDSPETRFRLARALLSSGDALRADDILQVVDQADLPEHDQPPGVVLLARIAGALDRLDESECLYHAALVQAENQGHGEERLAELWFELGGIYRRKEDHEAAAEAFAQATSLHGTPAMLMASGYEFLKLERIDDARIPLSEAALHEPDFLAVHQDLGYIAMQQGDNEEAVAHFMDAIDNAPLRPAEDEEQAQAVAEDVRRMRGEIRALRNAVDLDFWLTYTSGKTGTLGGLAAPGRDVLRTSSGIELGWIPPEWGFQDHRIFKLIGRLGWSMEPDSFRVLDNSWEAALGLRYKPLKPYNLNLGLERLFSLSGDGEDNWVARAMLSLFDDSDRVRPNETFWNYSFLFGEVDAYLESPSRLAAYVEGRQGFNWKVRDNLILTPFLVADAKWWSESRADDVSFYEGGLGLSTRYLYDEDKYSLPRKSVELLMTYKVGRIFNTDNIKDDQIDAFFATLLFRF